MTDNDAHHAWLDASRKLLITARGNFAQTEDAVRKICTSAFHEMLFSPQIVWDYLVVSTPGLFDESGYSDAEVEALMPMLETIMKSTWDLRSDR